MQSNLNGAYWDNLCKDTTFQRTVTEAVLGKTTEMYPNFSGELPQNTIIKEVQNILPKMINAKRVEDGCLVRLSHPHIKRMLLRGGGGRNFGNLLVGSITARVQKEMRREKKRENRRSAKSTSPRTRTRVLMLDRADPTASVVPVVFRTSK